MIDHRKITLGKLLIILACASFFSSAQSQTKLSSDDLSFIANSKIKYSIVLLSCDTCVPITNVGIRVRVILTNKEEKIVKQIDDKAWMLLLKNDKTDWAANLILYELCDRDAILLSQCKSRKRWIGFLKGGIWSFGKSIYQMILKRKLHGDFSQSDPQTISKFQKHSLPLPSLKGGISGIMIIINVKDGESLDKALKRFKKKFEKTGVLRELRSRQAFEKKSVTRRHVVKHAIYKQNMNLEATV